MLTGKMKSHGEDYVDPGQVLAAYEELDELRAKHPDIVAEVRPKDKRKTLMERFLEFYLRMHEHFHKERATGSPALTR